MGGVYFEVFNCNELLKVVVIGQKANPRKKCSVKKLIQERIVPSKS